MSNTLYLEIFSTFDYYKKCKKLKVPLESLITLSVYKFCAPDKVTVIFTYVDKEPEQDEVEILIKEQCFSFLNLKDVPWQVKSCVLPVIMFDDLIITGICAVARHISVYRSSSNRQQEHEDGLLGFRKSCLQAPNETSIWTKFCEVDMIKTYKEIVNNKIINSLPTNLVRFENHLNKPVKVHNVYKMARNLKKENMLCTSEDDNKKQLNKECNETRTAKPRKWNSNIKKSLRIDSSVKIEDLDIHHQFAEGPHLTLADIILFPNFFIIINVFGADVFKSILPQSYKWFATMTELLQAEGDLIHLLESIEINNTELKSVMLPEVDDVSLYKSDPKRHNPKKRLFTKEEDILAALETLNKEMEITISENDYHCDNIDWNAVPDGANPVAGHLPDDRKDRKTQQLENLAVAVLNIAKSGDLIVDFCSGSGHLGILIAYLLPECNIILLENKEQSLLRARKRVHEMNLNNVYFFQCNLDFFIGKFDIGVALHACGVASDLVLDKCLKSNAKFVLCPCCYGSLHATDRFVYPRSCRFSSLPIDKYLCIGHAADQTHEDHPLAVRGARCMAVIDSDRGRLAEESGYKVTLSRLKPLTCTPKNNLLVGVPT